MKRNYELKTSFKKELPIEKTAYQKKLRRNRIKKRNYTKIYLRTPYTQSFQQIKKCSCFFFCNKLINQGGNIKFLKKKKKLV